LTGKPIMAEKQFQTSGNLPEKLRFPRKVFPLKGRLIADGLLAN
jgi:hypothetical protein